MKTTKRATLLFIVSLLFAQHAFAASPSATNLSVGETYTEDTTLNLTDIVTSDTDGDPLTATLTLSSPTAGMLTTATSGAVTSTYNSGTGVWTASGAITDVNTLLAGVMFTPSANSNVSFTIATSISDGITSVTGSKAITGIAVNDPPSATNLSATESYTEDTTLNLIDIIVSDVDANNLTVTLTLSNPSAGALSTGTSGVVTSTYNAGTGVWTAAGAIADINVLLAGVTFTPAANGSTNFTIATSVSDGIAAALTGSKAMTGTAANDAPILDASRTPQLATVIENAGAPVGAVGTQVVSLVDFSIPAGGLDNVTDIDSSPVTGIAIIGTNLNLTCYFSINGGTTWSPVGAVSNTSARLLSVSTSNRVYCTAPQNTFGSFANALTFRAWDQTSGTNGATASTATNGATSAFSTSSDTITLTITSGGNHAPTAVVDEYTVDDESNTLILPVLDNDTDPENDTLTITSVSPIGSPAGDMQVAGGGTVLNYTPTAQSCGDEQYRYFISDGNNGTSNVIVTIHVTGCDTVTDVPSLVSPATGITYINNVPLAVTFTLPELLLHNSLMLTFTPSVGTPIVLSLMDAAPGTNTFSFDTRSSINTVTEVRSTTANSILAGNYTIALSYQDVFGNVAATAISTNVTIANPAIVSTSTGSGYNPALAWIPSMSVANATVDKKTCSFDMILTQNLRSGTRNGKYDSYAKGIVKQAKILQAHLNRLGFASGIEDGILGPKSDSAIKKLQKFLGTAQDGKIGPMTRELINNSCK